MGRSRKRGPRSSYAEQRRFVARLVSRNAYRDLVLSESVNVLTTPEIERVVASEFRIPNLGAILLFTDGEVIADSRGAGSQQVMT